MVRLETVRCARSAAIIAALAGSAFAQSAETLTLLAGQQMFAQGQYSLARETLESLLQDVSNGAPNDEFRAAIMDNLGVVNEGAGDYSNAERRFNEGLSILRAAPGDSSVDLKRHLAELYIREHRPQEAEPLLRQAVNASLSSPRPDPVALSSGYNDLAVACLMRRDFGEAETFSRQAQTIIETRLDSNPEALAGSLLTYAELLSDQHHFTEALVPTEHALQILRANKPTISKSYLASALTAAGAVYFRAGRNTEAESCARQAAELAEEVLGPQHRRVGLYLANYAAVLKHSGHKKEAKAIEKRSEKIRELYPAADDAGGYTGDVASLR